MAADDPFAAARAVAESVLVEGYLLYPYRRSSGKNRIRWQFGVLAPREWIAAQGIPDPGVAGSAESWFQQVDALAEAPADASVDVRVRFLQLERRQVLDGGVPVDALERDGRTLLSFDEGRPHEIAARFPLRDLMDGEQQVPIAVPGGTTRETRAGAEIVRRRRPLAVRLLARAEPAPAPFPLLRLRLRVENTAAAADPAAGRDTALYDALLATHVLAGLDRGRFLSLLDPPAWAAAAAAACDNRHVFPVLAGAGGGAGVLLAAPIILYDHPRIAPESPADLHDATEIDEILSLRTLTLTEDEKREARATDPRAAAIVDRVEAMPPELLARLHGALRDGPAATRDPDDLPWWYPQAEAAVDPQRDSVLVAGRRITRGSVVELRPRGRGSDAHDMFLTGRRATVHAVLHDVDGSVRVAVTVDDDPAADLHEWYGRFFHFTPDEISPVEVPR
jgi:hypothetical protein